MMRGFGETCPLRRTRDDRLEAPSAAAATTAAVSALAPITVSTTTAVRSTLFFGACFVHVERAPFQFLALQAGDCGLRLGLEGHFDERKTLRHTAEFVFDDIYGIYGSECLKCLSQIVFRDVA